MSTTQLLKPVPVPTSKHLIEALHHAPGVPKRTLPGTPPSARSSAFPRHGLGGHEGGGRRWVASKMAEERCFFGEAKDMEETGGHGFSDI